MGDKKYSLFEDFVVDGNEQDSTETLGKVYGSFDDFLDDGYEDNNVSFNTTKYNGPHISQEDFLDISNEGFGLIGDGREEIMQDALYNIYNPSRDEGGIQFEQFGAGNNIRVILPNGDTDEFGLGGGGTMFADESAKMKEDHYRLEQFIGQEKSKEVSLEQRTRFEEVLFDPILHQNLTAIDNKISEGLNLVGLKGDDGNGNIKSYKFEPVNAFTQAVRVTTPTGAKKTFNVGDFISSGYKESKQQTMNSIIRYIESDPKSFSQTDEYNNDLKKIVESIDPFLTEEYIVGSFGNDMLNPAVKGVLVQRIKKELGTLEGNFLGMGTGDRPEGTGLTEEGKVKKFKNLTREQQGDLINQKIEEYVVNNTEKYKDEYSAKEYKDLISQGLDDATIDNNIFGKDGRIYSRYTNDHDRLINLWQMKLDLATTDTDKKKAIDNINFQKDLKEEKGLGNKSVYLDMNTGQYTYSDSENVGEMVFNITNEDVTLDDGTTVKSINGQITALEEMMADGKLTREELKEQAKIINLATSEWEQKHKEDTHPIFLNTAQGLGNVEMMMKTDEWIKANPHMWTEFMYTNPEAAEAVSGYLSRLQLGIDLKGKRVVYDRVYGLNETVLSQENQGWSVLGEGFIKSVSTHEQNVSRQSDVGMIGEEFRQTYIEVMESDLGYTATAEDKEHAKASYGEAWAEGGAGLPKMMFDFWLANRALGVAGLNRILSSTTANLNKTRTSIKLADGTSKSMTTSQLKSYIIKSTSKTKIKPTKTTGGVGQEVRIVKRDYKNLSKTKPNSKEETKIIQDWIKKNAPNATKVKAHPMNRAASILTTSLYEGVKMDLAMQMPAITGMGYDPEMAPEIGSSFATGFGFGFMGGIIPWDKMFRGVMGVKTTKGGIGPAKPGLFGMEAAHKGFKPLPGLSKKEIAFKGMYDYLVAAPINFLAGSQFGSFTNQIADHMMEDKDWNDWLDENYKDWDSFLKHATTELLMGVAMRGHKFNRLDFTTEGRLMKIRQKANLGIWGDKKSGKEGIMEQRSEKAENGRVIKEYEIDPNTGQVKTEQNPDSPNYGKPVLTTKKSWVLRKGKTQEDLEPFQMLIDHATTRLNEMQDMKRYLDPITGPLELIRDMKPLLSELGVEKNTVFTYDRSVDGGFNMKFIEKGKRFYNPEKDAGKDYRKWTGKLNTSGETAFQGVFNPNKVNPGHVPHELLHVTTHKLFGEDVMFKGKYIDGLVELAKEMKTKGGITLYQEMVDEKVLKDGSDFDYKQVKEHELFSYVGEYFRQEGNQEMLVKQYSFDKLASLTHKQLSERFGVEPDRLNTRKDLVEFYVNYAKSIGEGRGFKGTFKHLEKFVSPTKTKSQQARREASDKRTGRGSTSEMKSTDLNKRMNELIEKRKVHPALISYKEDKDVEKFKNNPGIKKINKEIQEIKTAIENIPKDVVFTKKESNIERAVNDFARTGDRMMTNAEWKKEGLWDAYKELEKVGGKFDNLLTKGMNFEKGATIKGYNKSEWLTRVKWGIEGKTSTEQKRTYVDKGVIGTLERYKPETDLGGKESLSAWINKQYVKRQIAVKKWMVNNPKAISMETTAGEGKTIGDRLLAPEDARLKRFDEQDLSYGKKKEDALEWLDIVQVEGKRLKSELSLETKEFEKKSGWKETILDSVTKIENTKDVSPKDIMDIGIEFFHEMAGVKLTESQKNKPNDLGKDNLINFQKWIDMEYVSPVTEVGVNKVGEVVKRRTVDNTGGDVFKTVKMVETVETVLNRDATIKFDKGVSEKVKGTSSFKKLGTLAKLFHKATVKDYTAKELKDMGYEVNPTPNADGSWRVATGPGNAIWMPGKAKGKPITSENIKEFLGKKKDGSWTELSQDRSLAGKSRRIMEIINGSLVEQTLRDADVLDANIAWNLRSSKSQGLWSKRLGREKSFHNKKTFLEEVKTSAFYDEFYREVNREVAKGEDGSVKEGIAKALINHFNKVRAAKDSKFDMDNKALRQIAKEIFSEFKFSKKISPDVISLKAEKAVMISNDMRSVEAKYPDAKEYSGPSEFFDYKKGDLSDGYTREFDFAKRVVAKHGVGYYESHYLSGAAEGGGIGKYGSMSNMYSNIVKGLRYSILRGANKGFAEGKGKAAEEGFVEYDGYAMLDAVYKSVAKEKL